MGGHPLQFNAFDRNRMCSFMHIEQKANAWRIGTSPLSFFIIYYHLIKSPLIKINKFTTMNTCNVKLYLCYVIQRRLKC